MASAHARLSVTADGRRRTTGRCAWPCGSATRISRLGRDGALRYLPRMTTLNALVDALDLPVESLLIAAGTNAPDWNAASGRTPTWPASWVAGSSQGCCCSRGTHARANWRLACRWPCGSGLPTVLGVSGTTSSALGLGAGTIRSDSRDLR